jgi:hypothetical protein
VTAAFEVNPSVRPRQPETTALDDEERSDPPAVSRPLSYALAVVRAAPGRLARWSSFAAVPILIDDAPAPRRKQRRGVRGSRPLARDRIVLGIVERSGMAGGLPACGRN